MTDTDPAVSRHSGGKDAQGKIHNKRCIQSSLGILGGLVPRPPTDAKVLGCSSPFYKMTRYCWPSVSLGSSSADSTNHRDPKVVESTDVDPSDTESQLCDLPVGGSSQLRTNQLIPNVPSYRIS